MPSSSDFTGDSHFMTPYMSSVSRAGVILKPAFPNFEPNRNLQMLIAAAALPGFHTPTHCAHGTRFLSEDSLGEEAFEVGADKEALDAASEQMTAVHLANKGQMLTWKDPVGEWEDNRCSPVFREDDDSREDLDDPLFKKLEQLKEFQQQKQEQLKRHQMEQLQKLMEEQKMLLNMVSGQPAYLEIDQHQTSLVNQNIPRDYFPVQDHFSMSSSTNGQNVHVSQLSNNAMIPYRRPSSSSVQEHCLDISGGENHLGNEDSNGFIGENDMCEECKKEDSSPCGKSATDLQDAHNCFFQHQYDNCVESVHTEERPIISEIKARKQSFEEFLEEQMKLEEQRLRQNEQQQSIEEQTRNKPMKRPFLRRGEGLARFKNANTKLASKECKSIPPLKALDVNNTTKAEKPQIQRKIAPVSKEHVSENGSSVAKRSNKTDRGKSEPVMPIQKRSVLKNHNMKNSPLLTIQPENIYDGHVKSSVKWEKSSKLETNKQNMENAMLTETRNTLPNRVRSPGNTKVSTGTNSESTTNVNAKRTELSLEVSFQKRKANWVKETEKENFELDEFLLLEQAAEDISFSSNSSFVQKLLDQDYQIDNGPRRLSSTPVKLAQQQQVKKVSNVEDANSKRLNPIQTTTNIGATLKVNSDVSSISLREQYEKANGKILQSIPRESQTSRPTEWDTSEGEDDYSTSEDESNATMTSEKEDLKKLVLGSREDNPVSEECKGPSKTPNKDTKSRDFDLDLSDREDYNGDESVLKKKNKEIFVEDDYRLSSLNTSQVEFDDERTWADLEDVGGEHDLAEKNVGIKEFTPSDYTSRSPVSAPDKTIRRKVASKKGDDLLKTGVLDGNLSTPPTSDLMIKLFPSLKPKQKPESQLTNKSMPVQEDAGDTVRSQLLREKLVELETEIERFKMENATLAKLREDREKALATLRKEVTDFEQQKAKELARIEEFKKEEIKKLQKERKVFEKYASAARAIPDKKEREEIQSLKQQVTDLQEELKRKEGKWTTTHSRLRNQMETVSKENLDLREEIKFMEKVRLESWKKAEAAESNKKMVESHGMHLRRSDSISPPHIPKKSQNPSASHPEKSTKIIRRSQSPPKGNVLRSSKPTPVSDLSNSEKTKVNKTESTGITLLSSDIVPAVEQKNQISVIKGSEEDVQGEISYADGKVERILRNGCHVILFPNGTRKEVSADGQSTTVTFFNGDVKQVLADQRVIYYYADAQTTHTTYPDGLEILQFSNGQIEKHFSDGKKEITFPDQTIKNLYLDGREESIFPDGTIITVQLDGSKLIAFDNGQQELHTPQFKRREYPDGTVKTVYSNGQQETKYASGRVRVKDKEGNVIMDTKI
ncbi:centrosomal P4.1-associated protein isoform X1 [Ascaphus truei]|uniref:centrosomal P4.1-associated protein isoform X1 n=2 Tax=Ascaphus truei TaxID=8439 RepID=UPI003F5AA566